MAWTSFVPVYYAARSLCPGYANILPIGLRAPIKLFFEDFIKILKYGLINLNPNE